MLTTAAIRNFCTPALVYLALAAIGILARFLQVSAASMVDVNTLLNILLIPGAIALFWGWVLAVICRNGFAVVSWILVALPFFAQLLAVGPASRRVLVV